ncbi:ABC transporter substrate-binding protein [Enterovibrio norvegicus]|uniref:ABC transporter substrate-binding protein n=1 Tax=Enterovibrio norvegicus TaxID=188144 RepID=UPI00352CD250
MKTLFSAMALLTASFAVFASSPDLNDWSHVEVKAQGQHVYFHAWGGNQEINRYIQWAGKELQRHHNIKLHHVKVTDISETTTRLIAEKAAGKTSGGSVDLVWINGENFKSLKENQLLMGSFAQQLPHWSLVDQNLPVTVDFSEPTDGMEAPWGLSQLVFIYDKETLSTPPRTFGDMLNYAKRNPNRLSYPRPPEFHGTSFLKALLIELTNDSPCLSEPVDRIDFDKVTAPLWHYLDEFHQVAWRGGKQFPAGTAETLKLLDDGQIDLAITFNPNAVYAAQSAGNLAETTEAYAMEMGALSNIHYLTVPWNANAKEGALVAINFLLSPQAQSRKGDLDVWGDPAVLNDEHLSGSAKANTPFKAVAEPHPSWQSALEKAWLQRYGS